MDLISIRRKYRNIRNIIIAILLVILSIILIFLMNQIYKKVMYDKIYMSYQELQEQAQINEQQIEEQKRAEEEAARKAKLPNLTEEGKNNFANLYKSETKRVFLTFDDGPTKQVTPYILDLLKQENIKASFFVLGTRVESNPALVKREYEEGHFIGNHGYTHKYSSIYSSIDSVMNEYNKTNEAIKKAVGNDKFNSLVFRFPGGSVGGTYNDLKKEAERQLEEKGIGSVDWNALTNDAAGARTKEKILKNFYDTIQGKTSIVLLMHDAADKILTYETLPEIISYLKENGYEFKTMYDAIGRNIEKE